MFQIDAVVERDPPQDTFDRSLVTHVTDKEFDRNAGFQFQEPVWKEKLGRILADRMIDTGDTTSLRAGFLPEWYRAALLRAFDQVTLPHNAKLESKATRDVLQRAVLASLDEAVVANYAYEAP